jgi:hypothetical protein
MIFRLAGSALINGGDVKWIFGGKYKKFYEN